MHQNSNHQGILIMYKRTNILIALCSLILGACTVINQQSTPPPQKTQLQTRQVQTREYDTNDVKLVMKAVLNVLQDDGFIVRNAQIELGLLTATKEVDLQARNGSNDFWSDFFRGIDRNRSQRESIFNKLKQIESSVNVSEFGKQCKVRANFQVKILDNQGNTSEVYQVEDPKFYQEFFMKVDKGIFIQKQGF